MSKPSTIIIAEAGVNHNGDMQLAKQLIDAAADAGVDYIKFQTFKTDALVSKNAKKAAYQYENIHSEDQSQYNMLKQLELSEDDHYELMAYCQKRSIAFLSSAFDLGSIDFLDRLGLDLWKIPSGELTNLPYLKKIGSMKGEIILSTGMADMTEIRAALGVLLCAGAKKQQICILHCNTEYPTPFCDVNLNAMNSIQHELGVNVGYSDHTEGIIIPIAAVAKGARVIEKHFTLDKKMDGPDHLASLEPEELKAMVASIRIIEDALGSGVKEASNSETKNKVAARKSITALCDIPKGELFTPDNLIIKRPGNGINPMQWDEVIGKIATKDFKADELITL